MLTNNAHVIRAQFRFTGQLPGTTEMADCTKLLRHRCAAPRPSGDLVIYRRVGLRSRRQRFVVATSRLRDAEVWRFSTCQNPADADRDVAGRDLEHGGAPTWSREFEIRARSVYWPVGNPSKDTTAPVGRADNLYSLIRYSISRARSQERYAALVLISSPPHESWDSGRDRPVYLLVRRRRGRVVFPRLS
jgi:hypothetical protein